MTRPLELVGKTFGRLTVIAKNPILTASKNSQWDCVCVCGNRVVAIGSKLINGHTTSCGCFHLERMKEASVTHGLSRTPEYNSWLAMKQRCNNPQDAAYSRYGGRGILICERWENSFENFIHDMGLRPSPNHSIERKDNNLGYCPSNCVWATAIEQANNRRSSCCYEYNGVTKTVAEWSREFNIKYHVLKKRLNRNWDFERAITEPIKSDE